LLEKQTIVEKANVTHFYSFVKYKSKCHNSVPPLVRTDGSLCIDDGEKSNLLNTFFASVFVTDNGNIPELVLPPYDNSLNNVIFSYDTVLSALQKLPSKASKSPDGYPALFLKMIATVIAIPFSLLFEMSMLSNVIPKIWKTAIVCPIFKKGSPS